ncbi:uncharacterized protein LOC135168181 isoform X2 [Diachasmimorpha longicaudata]|uniref:uncharacterized protein LOC135168181 isoform X2 n=1 Tax=Diachasmimorpha longicaudata TaxID=58733 RepID=UPI0030B86A6F
MALRLRTSKDVKKSSYYVWYLGAREAKGVDAMPGAIAYLLERERLQEPFKVTLQVSSKGLKIIQTVHPGASTRSAVKHLVPGHAVLAAVQREDVVAATLLLPNPATNNPVHVHAYRCDSVETAELLGGQLKALASHSDNSTKVNATDTRVRSNLGSDGRSTRESESSEGSGEHRHIPPQTATIYESLAAELRAKLDEDWGNAPEDPEFLPETTNVALPRLPRSPERPVALTRGVSPNSHNRVRRAPEHRQRSPSPQYQPKVDPLEVTSPRERFQDAKEMFKAMERENLSRGIITRPRDQSDNHGLHRMDQSRLIHEDRTSRHISNNSSSTPLHHEHMIRRNHPELEREKERERSDYRNRPRVRGQHYSSDRPADPEVTSRPRPRSFYDNSSSGREPREQRHMIDHRETREARDRHSRDLREKQRVRPVYQDIPRHEKYLDRETRQSMEILPTPGRYRHSYAEPPRLGLAALDPY